jgi:hypothetical protein
MDFRAIAGIPRKMALSTHAMNRVTSTRMIGIPVEVGSRYKRGNRDEDELAVVGGQA